MQLSDYHFELPADLIAQHPAEPRDAARLLCADEEGRVAADRVFADLPELLRAGDLLILNDTRVIPARLYGQRETGGRVEFLLLERQGHRARALSRSRRSLRAGELVPLEGGTLRARFLERFEDGSASIELEIDPLSAATVEEELERIGHIPLPPYIHRSEAELLAAAQDRERYQTVYAREKGSVAAPTAGLHFTARLFDRLRIAGVAVAFVTLHVGRGTFEPVRAERIADHRMHSEWGELPAATVEQIQATRQRGGRVIAVGTTSLRVLESARRANGSLAPWSGWTELFLKPGDEIASVDGLITNFHLPMSTLLMLVAALIGRDQLFAIYAHAINHRYRFYSYGDAMLLWRREHSEALK